METLIAWKRAVRLHELEASGLGFVTFAWTDGRTDGQHSYDSQRCARRAHSLTRS